MKPNDIPCKCTACGNIDNAYMVVGNDPEGGHPCFACGAPMELDIAATIALYRSEHEQSFPTLDPYGSHQPMLCAAVAATTGPVVELGAGLSSTPLLQALCLAQARPLLTIDNNREWLNAVWRPHSPLHRGTVIANWKEDLHRWGEELTCGVCLIDLAPAPDRASAIRVMKRWAQVICVHDTETEQRGNYPGVEEALQTFRYRIDDRRRGPWASLVSDAIDVATLLKEAIA